MRLKSLVSYVSLRKYHLFSLLAGFLLLSLFVMSIIVVVVVAILLNRCLLPPPPSPFLCLTLSNFFHFFHSPLTYSLIYFLAAFFLLLYILKRNSAHIPLFYCYFEQMPLRILYRYIKRGRERETTIIRDNDSRKVHAQHVNRCKPPPPSEAFASFEKD